MLPPSDEKRQRRSRAQHRSSFFRTPPRKLFLLIALTSFSGFVIIEEYGDFLAIQALYRRLGRREGSMDIQLEIDTITPFAEVCPEEYPPSHAKLHDRRAHEVHDYNKTYGDLVNKFNFQMDKKREFPDLMEYKNYKYAIWNPGLSLEAKEFEASAWDANNDLNFVTGTGFTQPREYKESRTLKLLEGNFATFNSWFPGNFGHFAHDWLPSIALMRHILPEDTKFLLLENNMSRKFIKFLDPDFYFERVMWIRYDQVYHVMSGSLTVHLPLGTPDPILGCCSGWDPMRQWIAEKKPKRIPEDQKHVVFYSRKSNKNTKHGRILDPVLENKVLMNIAFKLRQHKKPQKVVIFNGQDQYGRTLSIEEQFEIFRGAFAFIGPHGSGLGGNYLWMDPFASKCEERTQLLEFMPGPETPKVHALYASYYGNIRKWPLDYHSLLYTNQSTYALTYVDLQYLKDALDAMWGTPETMSTRTIAMPEEDKEEESPTLEDRTVASSANAEEEVKNEDESNADKKEHVWREKKHSAANEESDSTDKE